VYKVCDDIELTVKEARMTRIAMSQSVLMDNSSTVIVAFSANSQRGFRKCL